MKKKVLVFIDWFLPGTRSGGPVRSCANLIQHFEKELDFRVITRDTDYCEKEPYQNIEHNDWNQISSNTKIFYLSKDFIRIKIFQRLLKKVQYDVVYVNGIYSFFFSILPLLLLRKSNIKKIVAVRGMLNPQAFSTKKKKKEIFLWIANNIKLYKDVIFHATNNDEKKYIKNKINNYSDIVVAANLPRKLFQTLRIEKKKNRGELRLICIARISKEKGILYALQVLSKIKEVTIQFDLYGPIYDCLYWNECQEEIKQLPTNITVSYKGSVHGEKIPELLTNYHFLFMPSVGENFGHSILEALLAACPVIISDQTPWKDLEKYKVGWDLPLNQSSDFIDVITTAGNMSQRDYEEWSLSAFEYGRKFSCKKETIEANHKLFL